MNAVVTILGALIVTKGFWDLLQLIVNRTGRKAEVARSEAQTEMEREQNRAGLEHGEVTRLKEAAEVTAAQWKSSYERLQLDAQEYAARYQKCHDELARKHNLAARLIDVFGAWVARMRAGADDTAGMITVKVTSDEFLALRTTISDAWLELG